MQEGKLPSYLPNTDPSFVPDSIYSPVFFSQGCEPSLLRQDRQVFDPNLLANILWDLLMIVCIYYMLFEAGFVIFFGPGDWQETSLVLPSYYIIAALLAADILLCQFKGFYERGQLVRNHKVLLRKYWRFTGWVDIIFLLSVILPPTTQIFWLNYLKIVTLLKLVKLKGLRGEVVQRIELNNSVRVGFLVVMLLVDIFAISHYIACIFYYLDVVVVREGLFPPSVVHSWIYNGGVYPGPLQDTPWYVQYIYAQGFGMGTLATLAPSPAPQNPPEALFGIASMMFCTLFIAFVGDALVEILYGNRGMRIEHEDKVYLMNEYFLRNGISALLTAKIKTYFEYMWHINAGRNFETEQEVKARLTPALSQNLTLELYGSFLPSLSALSALPDSTTFLPLLLDTIT
jgi:hypothetical protein